MYLHLAHFGVLAALLAAVAPLPVRSIKIGVHLTFTLLGISGIMSAYAGIMGMLSNSTSSTVLPIGLPWLHSHQYLDPLAGFFLLLVGGVSAIVSLFGPKYVILSRPDTASSKALALFTGLFIAGMYLVILAADAFSFMVAWELMSVASYFLVAHDHSHQKNTQAAFIYLLMAQAGGCSFFSASACLPALGVASPSAPCKMPLWPHTGNISPLDLLLLALE